MRVVGWLTWTVLVAACTLRGTDYLQEGLGGGDGEGGAGAAGGSGGAGGAPCEIPLADCNADGSCETDLSGDAESCGVCGYPCPGLCRDGSCRLAEVGTALGANIAIDEEHAYFTTLESRIFRVRLDGIDGVSPLVEEFDIWTLVTTDIHVDATNVFWTAQALTGQVGVWYKAKDAASEMPTEVWLNPGLQPTQAVGSVGGDSQRLVFSYAAGTDPDPLLGDVLAKFKSDLTMTATLVAMEPPAVSLVTTTSNDVLWLSLDALRHWSPSSGTETIVSGLASPSTVALDGDIAFIASVGVTAEPDGRVERLQWDPPGRPEVLLDGLGEPFFLAIDNVHVYLSESAIDSPDTGSIKRIPKDGGEVQTLFRGSADKDVVGDLALTSDSIVWLAEGPNGAYVAPVEVWRRSKEAYPLP